MAYIGEDLERFAATAPARTALSCGAVRLSRQELLDQVQAIETALRGQSPRGGRIALCLKDPVALVICFLACARSGRIALVLDPDWPDAQTEKVLFLTAPVLEIDADRFAALSGLRQGFLYAATSAAPSLPSEERQQEDPPHEDDPFYAGFTSGSTGTPKGYLRTHGSWLRSFALSDTEFGGSETDCTESGGAAGPVVLAGQLTHSLHLYGAVYGLCSGREVVLAPRFDPRAVFAELQRAGGGASLYATPTQLHYLAEAARRAAPAGSVRQVFSSGAKWGDEDRKALAAVFPQARLIEFYGASETSFITVAVTSEAVPEGSVGRAAAGVSIAIGDPASPFAAGLPGPVWVKSDLLFSGYICGDAPETRWQDGWLTFGDHGSLDEDGFLFLTGRAGRMIVTSGLNVYPEEIEAVLCDHPAVAVAVVLGLADPVRGQRLEAVVQLGGPLEDASHALVRHCRTRLPAGKVPRRIHLRKRLPLTAGGKPDIRKIGSDFIEAE